MRLENDTCMIKKSDEIAWKILIFFTIIFNYPQSGESQTHMKIKTVKTTND